MASCGSVFLHLLPWLSFHLLQLLVHLQLQLFQLWLQLQLHLFLSFCFVYFFGFSYIINLNLFSLNFFGFGYIFNFFFSWQILFCGRILSNDVSMASFDMVSYFKFVNTTILKLNQFKTIALTMSNTLQSQSLNKE